MAGNTQIRHLEKRSIIKMLESHKADIKEHGVKRIGLFGSALKGSLKRKSDLDFLVTFDKPTFDGYMDLKFMLERLFHRKIDLVLEENLKARLRYVKGEALYVKGL